MSVAYLRGQPERLVDSSNLQRTDSTEYAEVASIPRHR